MHAPAQVILHVSKPIRQRKCQLRYWVSARLGNMVAGNRYRVKIPYLIGDKILLDIAHHAQGKLGRENAGVLRLVLFQYIGLHRTAHSGDGFGFYLLVNIGRQYLVARKAEEHKTEAVVAHRYFTVIYRPW